MVRKSDQPLKNCSNPQVVPFIIFWLILNNMYKAYQFTTKQFLAL